MTCERRPFAFGGQAGGIRRFISLAMFMVIGRRECLIVSVAIIRSRGPVALPVQGRRCCYRLRHAAAPEGPLGAVEHLETLCRLGLKPERAMIAVVPVLHEIIPVARRASGSAESDATMGGTQAKIRKEPQSGQALERILELHFANVASARGQKSAPMRPRPRALVD